MSKKKLQSYFPNGKASKGFFKPYDYLLSNDDKDYYIKTLQVNENSILSINSKYVWEVKTGRISGINFKTSSKNLIDMKGFNELPNKIIVFKGEPYKILKYINESEVIDISNSKEINGIKIFNNIEEIII
ncbi:hypothetical protein KQ51_00685 [Candidatus Izimaplasma bacterium HR1]|jgi:hypothetical protein|uniref:hypothetical protein n=1 Tax=Candidatus Izimoplasma sp. HR1 TaxID=1541959 RepID=UPI0004F7A39E|nr:hypothetical protein KQ51_00685 [Candidatus Izimaplasma bacterium HR1]